MPVIDKIGQDEAIFSNVGCRLLDVVASCLKSVGGQMGLSRFQEAVAGFMRGTGSKRVRATRFHVIASLGAE